MKKLYIMSALSLMTMSTIDAQETDSLVVLPKENYLAPYAIDTIPTDDRFLRIVLYDNNTWEYLEIERPQIEEDDFAEEWNNEKVHAYKGISMDDIPEEDNILLTDSLHPYHCPLKGIVRSGYKWRRRRPHKGVDIPLITGTPIRAAFDGKVRVVMKTRQTGGYGNLIVIRHPNGLETYYGHLSVHKVKENDIVKAGEIIGLGGNTGRSTGPHLHFETRYMGQAFDPERIFNFQTGELRDSIFTFKKHYLSIYSHYGMTEQESKDASKRIMYKVKSGDNLGSIAKKYGTTVANICKLNKISTKKTLRVGQNLIVR